jgi:hypothetical protein
MLVFGKTENALTHMDTGVNKYIIPGNRVFVNKLFKI